MRMLAIINAELIMKDHFIPEAVLKVTTDPKPHHGGNVHSAKTGL